ncbi:hypothetical protein [Pedobacter sp.]|uniref:hypothetical protein n=1 Tax=Pedobacter sp. TaxID=1411316 RepID=UPI003D7FA134
MMNQGDLFKKIGNILTELQDQYQELVDNPQSVNELELSLFLSNANFLRDHIQIVIKAQGQQAFKSLPAAAANTSAAEKKENNLSVDQTPDPFQFLLDNDHHGDQFEFEEQHVGELFNRPLTPEEQEIIAKKQALKAHVEPQENSHVEEEVGPEPFLVSQILEEVEEEPLMVEVIKEEVVLPLVTEVKTEMKEEFKAPDKAAEPAPVKAELREEVKAAEPAPVKDPVVEEQPKLTLNELLANKRHASSNAEPSRTDIKDLKQAISLNDKLIFIKDLFHGYSLAYAEVIELLNKMPDFKTADQFLQHNYAIKNDWQSKQETVDRFYELLSRRFPVK